MQAKRLNIQLSYKQQKTFAVKATLAIVLNSAVIPCFNAAVFLIQGLFMAIIIFQYLSYSIINNLRTLYIAQLSLACLSIQKRFKVLNNSLVEMIRKENFKFMTSLSNLNIRKAYHDLCNLIDIINETFTFHFILLFPNVLVRTISTCAGCVKCLLINFRLFQIASVFSAFGLVRELENSSEPFSILMIISVFGMLYYLTLIVLTIYAGSALTKEAEKTTLVINCSIAEVELTEAQKIDFVFFMSQIRSRNLNVQNIFFKINWRTLMAVSST